MPTYEYACTQCGQHVEVFQRLSEEPLTTCGACGGPLRKVFHPAGIVFKGSGFYATDSRSKPKASPDGARDTSGDGGGKEAGGGGDAGTDRGDGGKEARKRDAPASGASSGSGTSSSARGSTAPASTGGEKSS